MGSKSATRAPRPQSARSASEGSRRKMALSSSSRVGAVTREITSQTCQLMKPPEPLAAMSEAPDWAAPGLQVLVLRFGLLARLKSREPGARGEETEELIEVGHSVHVAPCSLSGPSRTAV